MTIKQLSRALLGLMVLVSAALPAYALLNAGGVSSLSGSNNISRTNPGSVTLRWTMGSFGFAPGNRISSPNGRFIDSVGTVLGINNTVLSKSIIPGRGLFVNETLRIPRKVLHTAYKMGLTQITYVRAFTDCPAADCNNLIPEPSITFNLTGSAGATFGITDYKLRFDTDSVSSVFGQGESHKARAYINVTSTGTIRGAWELATPSSTAGTPVYRTLKIIQRQLTGSAVNVIDSPALPTRAPGIYLLRFRFVDPLLPGAIPTIQYAVNRVGLATEKLVLQQPQNATELTEQTRFSWQALSDAAAYRLEFIAPPQSPQESDREVYTPVAGIMLKPSVTQLRLNRNVYKKLQPGRVYWWRVLGLDDRGTIISQSVWRSVSTKP